MLQLLRLELTEKLDEEEGHLDGGCLLIEKLPRRVLCFLCALQQTRHKMLCKAVRCMLGQLLTASDILEIYFGDFVNLLLADF